MGYALTGDTRHECFFVLYGPTSRNGKGTTMETYMRMMGDYGRSAKPDTIAQKQAANGSGPSEDIARLVGARFVNISEPDQKLILSAALVKTLTGNDTITARYLHENSFEYRPQFKLFINTNHLPKVTDITLFSSGRVKLIPFERHFTEAEQDGNLKGELAKPQNLSGILNWCIQGLRLIQEQGFAMPDSVRAATDEYRNNSDKLGRFLADEMIKDASGEVQTSVAYQRFTKWCDDNGFRAENASNFKQMMENIADVVRKRPAGGDRTTNPVNMIVGYRLRFDEFLPTDEPTPWSNPRYYQTDQQFIKT
jgi:putative DNA primase/helicase